MALIEDNFELLSALAFQAARSVKRHFLMVDYDDLAQEAMLWCVQNRKKLGEYLAEEDRSRRERSIVGAMRNACKDYARRERAAQLGTDIDDDAWYRFGELRDSLLPAVYDPEAWLYPPTPAVKTRGGDPAEGGNWVAALSDVSRALGALEPKDRRALDLRYGQGLQFRRIADELGVSTATAHTRVSRAIKRLHDALGGSEPHSGPGARRAITNAHARAITGNDYEEG